MMSMNWNYPTTVWVGENRINDLCDACKNLDIIKPLFVTDKDLVNLPFIKNIILIIEDDKVLDIGISLKKKIMKKI